jgi:uncharacterized protein
MSSYAPYLAAFLTGLIGGTHCLAMCGGIVAILKHSSTQTHHLLWQNLGRLSTYTGLGIAAALLSHPILLILPANNTEMLLRNLMAIFMIVLGLTLAGWSRYEHLTNRLGSQLWRQLQPHFIRLQRLPTHRTAYLAGMLWGFLPCGLVYAMLPGAALSGSPWQGGLLMLSFGLGTSPWVGLLGAAWRPTNAMLCSTKTRQRLGIGFILFGAIALFMGFSGSHHPHH